MQIIKQEQNLPEWFNNFSGTKPQFDSIKILNKFRNLNFLLFGENIKGKRKFIYEMVMTIKQENPDKINYFNFEKNAKQFEKEESFVDEVLNKYSHPNFIPKEVSEKFNKSLNYHDKIKNILKSNFLIVDNLHNLNNITKQNLFIYDIAKKRAYNPDPYISFIILNKTLEEISDNVENERKKEHLLYYPKFFTPINFK